MITKKCTVSGKEFEITQNDLDFYLKMEVISQEDYEKLKSREISDCVGLPTLCPDERQRRRISHRNFINLYQRKCDATDKMIITNYHDKSPFPVYSSEYWWSDNWEAKEYGQEFDFSRNFFPQFHELYQKVPRFSNYNINCENCDYSTAFSSRNCYLIAGSVRSEDSCYGHIVWDSKDCFDNLYTDHSEICSNCIDCTNCYDIHFSTESNNCNSCYFIHDCLGCSDCFGCTGLRKKRYCFLNKQLTKTEYEEKIRGILPLTQQTIDFGNKWLEKTKKEQVVFPELFGLKNENISGNHIYESRNCKNCFDSKKAEYCKYLYTTHGQKNCLDISFTGKENRFFLEGLSAFNCENSKFSFDIHDSVNMEYGSFCFSCRDCFGCTGMRNAQYCIFNKQYTKEEYFKLREKIISHMKKSGEWGEFFPIELSPFSYNETVANEYFPMTEEEIIAKNLKYREEKQNFKYDGPKYEIPARIEEVDDEILDKILTCEATGKYYKIQKSELKFYRKMNLPIPRLCPDERHKRRMALRNPRNLFSRNCTECDCEIQTTFSPERPEKVFCEKCYLNEVN